MDGHCLPECLLIGQGPHASERLYHSRGDSIVRNAAALIHLFDLIDLFRFLLCFGRGRNRLGQVRCEE